MPRSVQNSSTSFKAVLVIFIIHDFFDENEEGFQKFEDYFKKHLTELA